MTPEEHKEAIHKARLMISRYAVIVSKNYEGINMPEFTNEKIIAFDVRYICGEEFKKGEMITYDFRDGATLVIVSSHEGRILASVVSNGRNKDYHPFPVKYLRSGTEYRKFHNTGEHDTFYDVLPYPPNCKECMQ